MKKKIFCDNSVTVLKKETCKINCFRNYVYMHITDETGTRKFYLRKKIEEYMNRAEEIQREVNQLKEAGKYHEQINIANGSTGHSYERVLGRFLDNKVIEVEVQDPYIRSHHQCQNFLRLCELLKKKCGILKRIVLVTGQDGGASSQETWLNSIRNDLLRYQIQLDITFSCTLHDRQILYVLR